MHSSISISSSPNPKARSIISVACFLATAIAAGLAVWTGYIFCIVRFLDDAVILRGNDNLIRAKLAPLEKQDRVPHLIIVSGSNGFYSIDSNALSTAIGMPVTNAAVQWSYAMYMLDRIIELSKPGDVVLLPLEFQYFTTITQKPPLESCHALTHDRRALTSVASYASAILNCNPSVVFDGFRLQLLAGMGLQFPPYNAEDYMTPSGDILENIPSAATYRTPTTFTTTQIEGRTFGHERLADQIRTLTTKGVRVFLTYPVSPAPDDAKRPIVDDAWIKAYKKWGASLGATVISTPEAHIFPVECFFDTNYHLHRGCTAQNSAKYVEALTPYLTRK